MENVNPTDMLLNALASNALLFTMIGGTMILLYIARTPWGKGKLGEFMVNAMIKIFLDKDEYRLIKDVTLPTDDGTTQIDHIIVSKYGIFVIETKNMRGWIFGSAKQATWTQKLFQQSYKFQNPLRQNYKHTKTLAANLGINEKLIHSVIVFVGDSAFKSKMPPNVTYARGCIEYIKSFRRPVIHSNIDHIAHAVKRNMMARGSTTNKAHRAHLNKKFGHK